jgi:hypothetical protein
MRILMVLVRYPLLMPPLFNGVKNGGNQAALKYGQYIHGGISNGAHSQAVDS